MEDHDDYMRYLDAKFATEEGLTPEEFEYWKLHFDIDKLDIPQEIKEEAKKEIKHGEVEILKQMFKKEG